MLLKLENMTVNTDNVKFSFVIGEDIYMFFDKEFFTQNRFSSHEDAVKVRDFVNRRYAEKYLFTDLDEFLAKENIQHIRLEEEKQ